MKMNPLAQHLNDRLGDDRPEILSMLSTLGQSMFYPKGILSQSAEAKSTKYNATIGMATNDKGKCMQTHYLMSTIIFRLMRFSHMLRHKELKL